MGKIFTRLLQFCFVAVLLMFVASCSKEEDSISVSPSSIELSSQGAQFTVTSNVDWTLTQSGNYKFSVSPVNGLAGTTTVSVSYTVNDTDQAREATVSVAGGSAVATLQLTQQPLEFSVSEETMSFGAEASTKSLKIQSNTDWNINGITIPDWITSITPSQGSGNGELKITVTENTSRLSEKNYLLRITYGGTLFKRIEVKQEAAFNNSPTQPVLTYPQDKAIDVSTMPLFSWEASEDIEGDNITYTVYISEDKENWNNFSAGEMTSVLLPARIGILKPNTIYYYKVAANDGHNKGVTESAIYSFITTATKDAYADGDYTTYMKSTKANPVYLIFTGDGYLAEHFKYGGQFDADVDAAIEAFFAVEPYKSYREYFTVYKIAAYSNQTGITNLKTNDRRDTRFRLEWEGGNSTGISIPDSGSSIFALCKTIEGITEGVLRNGAIGVVSNADVYAGTCWHWADGKSISLIPYLRNPKSNQTTFANVVSHEMGGHGFGRLADEYVNSSGRIPEDEVEVLLAWQSYGAYRNVSAKPQQSESPWSNFIGVQGYSHVGMYEGGFLYKQGIWRPEQISCMEDNRLYYNSPSRYFIVERIMQIAGEQLTMEKFVEKDVNKTDNTQTKSVDMTNFIPLGKPVLIK